MKTVAILLGDPALSSIVSGVIEALPEVRVCEFTSLETLTIYMRIAPVDLIILNFDGKAGSPELMARALHADHRLFRGFGVIALTRAATDEARNAAHLAGIDELIDKPVSPKHLCERVVLRLGMSKVASLSYNYRGPERRRLRSVAKAGMPASALRQASNVIQLFGEGRQSRG
jgi:response regulator RpfG family c-di-GMP phosphodiesterase